MTTNLDLDAIKEFFGTHPGSAGATIPIPAEAKKVSDGLNGNILSLRKAVDMIKKATPDGIVSVKNGWIALEIRESDGTKHIFRVIRFKNAGPAYRLKAKWMEMPDDFFQPQTFGELMAGQKFICLPLPGDGDEKGDRGGFRGPYYIHTKISRNKAVENRSGHVYSFPSSMYVVCVA